MFLGRGVYEIDRQTGDTLRIFRGADKECLGGALWRTGDRLVTVSNRAVTAYPIPTNTVGSR